MIPISLLLDAVLIFIALMIDTQMDSQGKMGHGLPAVSLAVAFICAVITIALTVRSIILSIAAIVKNNQKDEKIDGTDNKPKAIWTCFIPIAVQVLISVIIVFLYGRNEMNNFYSEPKHIGFSIPMGTFLIAAVALILFVITLVITLVVVGKKLKAERNGYGTK